MITPKNLFSYPAYREKSARTAPYLPMSRAEMDALGWDSCDVILVTGDAYIDHPSFGMALVGRLLESQGFRVGIISQPDWRSVNDFQALGKPNLYFGITAGNMDSMVNRYTADRKIRSDDAYTPHGEAGKRPDRAVMVYGQKVREAYPGVAVVAGSIEASLRRIAHYDYWSDTVRRSILLDCKADILLFGNAERALIDLTHRMAAGEKISTIRDLRGSAFIVPQGWKPTQEWVEINSVKVDAPGKIEQHIDPYMMTGTEASSACATTSADAAKAAELDAATLKPIKIVSREERLASSMALREKTVLRLPSYDVVKDDPVMYAHASRVFHLDSNPGNARALVQRHGDRDVWLNPPPIPLTTGEMDGVYELPYARLPHPSYGKERIPAYHMIRFSVSIQRGCFGGCTFCSITEHEGRIIQSRSEDSVIREIETIRDSVPGFTGVISDLGGPTANMYRLHCKSPAIESACRRPSCVFPGICPNLDTDHAPLIRLYRRARSLKGIKKILIASGVRYDLAIESPEYVKELATHHTGGYLKIAPEAIGEGPLSKMMKPGVGTYYRFKELFDRYSKEAGKEQYLIPYFIAAHPGTRDQDMLELALWLKKNDFRADQVQAFLPSPMASATAMYHSGKNPLKRVSRTSEEVVIPKGTRQRRLHKAFLRYHDPENWPVLRDALKRMGRQDLIGNGKHHLVPAYQPLARGRTAANALPFRTQHTGLPRTPGRRRRPPP